MKLIIGNWLWLVCVFLSAYALGAKLESGGYRVTYDVEEKINEHGICKKVLTQVGGFFPSKNFDVFVPTQQMYEWEQFIQSYQNNQAMQFANTNYCFQAEQICLSDCPLEAKLNDTCVTWSVDETGNYKVSCESTVRTIGQQDCSSGRDIKNADGQDGQGGFSFSRLNMNGSRYNGSGDYSKEPWACVEDKVTGLVWEVKTKNGGLHDQSKTYSWGGKSNSGAKVEGDWSDLVDKSNQEQLCGYDDWRVPSISELFGLALFKQEHIYDNIELNYFPNNQRKSIWSSSLSYNDPWAVDFSIPTVFSYKETEKKMVRLVRGRDIVSPNDTEKRYKLFDNGTVIDNLTQLMWQRCSVGQTWQDTTCSDKDDAKELSWKNALEYGPTNNFAGYGNWRMPNIKELHSLVIHQSYNPALNIDVFPNNQIGGYWSSTPRKPYAEILTINFKGGGQMMLRTPKSSKLYLRLVRDLPDSGN